MRPEDLLDADPDSDLRARIRAGQRPARGATATASHARSTGTRCPRARRRHPCDRRFALRRGPPARRRQAAPGLARARRDRAGAVTARAAARFDRLVSGDCTGGGLAGRWVCGRGRVAAGVGARAGSFRPGGDLGGRWLLGRRAAGGRLHALISAGNALTAEIPEISPLHALIPAAYVLAADSREISAPGLVDVARLRPARVLPSNQHAAG